MDWMMQNLPIIICGFVGIVMLVIEFFMPGFGLAGLGGLLFLSASVVFTWLEHGAYAGLAATVLVLLIGTGCVTVFLKSAARGRISRSSLMLHDNLKTNEASADLSGYLGKTGTAQTALRPAGIALIDGERVNVVSSGEYIESGAAVRVDEVEGGRVQVSEVKE